MKDLYTDYLKRGPIHPVMEDSNFASSVHGSESLQRGGTLHSDWLKEALTASSRQGELPISSTLASSCTQDNSPATSCRDHTQSRAASQRLTEAQLQPASQHLANVRAQTDLSHNLDTRRQLSARSYMNSQCVKEASFTSLTSSADLSTEAPMTVYDMASTTVPPLTLWSARPDGSSRKSTVRGKAASEFIDVDMTKDSQVALPAVLGADFQDRRAASRSSSNISSSVQGSETEVSLTQNRTGMRKSAATRANESLCVAPW